MFSAKFFAEDFVGGKIPTEVDQIATVGSFFGQKNVKVKVIELWGSCVLAEMV